jgi:hypothetical protein
MAEEERLGDVAEELLRRLQPFLRLLSKIL